MNNQFSIGPTLTPEQEYYLVYEHLLSNLREVEADESLSAYVASAQRDVEQFEENYPEIVSEYMFNKRAIVELLDTVPL